MASGPIVGIPFTITLGFGGVHGPAGTGVHGIGTSTPSAAAVAAATAGLASEIHSANGVILTKGILSIIVAMGIAGMFTIRMGKTFNGAGAIPIEHFIRHDVLQRKGLLINCCFLNI